MDQFLKVENFRLAFNGPRGRVPALRGVDFSMDRGEILAIVGESGSGKTALCRCMLMLHQDHAEIESGRIVLCDKEVTSMTNHELGRIRGRDAAIVFQDPMTSLNPVFSIGAQIMDPIMLHEGLSRKDAEARALSLIKSVGLDHPEERMKQHPHQLSGGQRQRAAIAIALSCDPALLIADEPTTALDMDSQQKIMDLLASICEKRDRGVIFITHDLGLARDLADRILVMKDGLIVEEGTSESIFAAPEHPYTKDLLRYASYGKSGSHHHGRIVGGEPEDAADPFSGAPTVVTVRDLCKNFRMGRGPVNKVLDNFNMSIRKGETVGLIGPSGAGKSTLARCLMGIYVPDSGTVEFAEGTRRQMIFQDSASAFNPRMTIRQIIAEPLVIAKKRRRYGAAGSDKKLSKAEIDRKVDLVMEQVELPLDLADRHPYDVSGGERQRAAIARALITDPDVLIADEPISSLDVSIQAQIIHLLKRLQEKRDLTMLIISHDLPMVMHVSDRVLKM